MLFPGVVGKGGRKGILFCLFTARPKQTPFFDEHSPDERTGDCEDYAENGHDTVRSVEARRVYRDNFEAEQDDEETHGHEDQSEQESADPAEAGTRSYALVV